MSPEKKLITVVIPHRASETIDATLEALERARAQAVARGKKRAAAVEVLAVSGNQPSVQRNRAVREAGGEYIYFLDNDSEPAPDCLARIADFFAGHKEAAIYGGPSLTPATDSRAQKAFGHVLGSFIGTAFMSARYRPAGTLRPTTDRELILCNLAFRRSVFLELGGFDEKLYPNEENDLMDRTRLAGYGLWYDPELVVRRSQRPGLAAFIRQLFGYGRGRAEQMKNSPLASNLVPFVFMLFPLAVLALPFLVALAPVTGLAAAAYVAVTGLAALPALARGAGTAALAWLAFFLCHFSYGAGLWAGLVLPYRSRSVRPQSRLKRIALKGRRA